MALRPRPYIGLPMFASAGTAAAPGVRIGAVATGLYYANEGRSALGLAIGGLQGMTIGKWSVVDPDDGTVVKFGRSGIWTNPGEHYITSIFSATQQVTGANPQVVFANIFGGDLTSTDQVQKEKVQIGLEIDKVDLRAAAGAVTWVRAIGLRVRVPIAHANSTVTNVHGMSIAPPNASDNLGTFTNASMAWFQPVTVGVGAEQPTNGWMGCLYADGYTQHLMTETGVDLKLGSAAGMILTADNGKYTFASLPTSDAGLTTGMLYSDSGTVKVKA